LPGSSVHVIIDSHSLLLNVWIGADVLIADFEANVICVVAIRLYP
jgi:hypothetical protein